MTSTLRAQLELTLSGQYDIERELGGGAMSRVFLAKDKDLGRQVVIKVLPEELTESVSFKRFEREIRLAAVLQQANIVPVLSAGAADGLPYYTMPFVEGLSLRERLTHRGRPSLPETIGILRDVARALAYAHERGVVHRDVKPENILLSGGAAVATDFGIAKALENARLSPDATDPHGSTVTRAGMAVGTPGYMAPEQISGDPGIDHRVDLYSFGCLAYELLAGRTPFGARPVHALFSAHLSEQPTLVGKVCPECPPVLARMVMRCLEKDPAARPQSAQDLLLAMDAGPVPATRLQRFTRRLTRRQRLGVLAVMLVAASGIGTLVVRSRGIGSSRIQSLAVLPLENLSGDSARQYLADGMHEALINRLSRVGGVRRVIGRRSVMRYRTQDMPLSQVARELDVQAIVTASLQVSDDSVHVTANLINPADGGQIWSQQYRRPMRDVRMLEDEIASAILRRIGLTVTAEEASRLTAAASINPEAYQDYLKGRFFSNRTGAASLETALRYFESALQKERDYALAYAGIAEAWWLKGNVGHASFGEAHSKAKAAALKAVQLDEFLAEGHDMLGRILIWYEWDWQGAEQAFRRAIELNPNYPDSRTFYSTLLMTQARPAEAQSQIQRAMQLGVFQRSCG